MNSVPKTDWRIVAEQVASCNCAWGCPCQFWAVPTHGSCEALEATEIERGHFGETALDGVRYAQIYHFDGPIHEGNGWRRLIGPLDLKEGSAMDTIPQWRLVGDWFDVCKCDIPCPCEFAQPPTGNTCEGVLAYHVRQGHYGDVQLDGLNLVAIGAFEGNVWAGETRVTLGLFIDERADAGQRQALQTIFGGQAGGWPAQFATLVGEMRGVEFVPIEFEIADDLAFWRADVPGRVQARAEALTGPTTPPGQRVQLLNPPGSEVGPGQVATWGRATTDRVEAFGFTWEWDGKSSKHIPFDWSGPEPS